MRSVHIVDIRLATRTEWPVVPPVDAYVLRLLVQLGLPALEVAFPRAQLLQPRLALRLLLRLRVIERVRVKRVRRGKRVLVAVSRCRIAYRSAPAPHRSTRRHTHPCVMYARRRRRMCPGGGGKGGYGGKARRRVMTKRACAGRGPGELDLVKIRVREDYFLALGPRCRPRGLSALFSRQAILGEERDGR